MAENNDIYTRDGDGNLAMRTATTTEAAPPSNSDDLYTRDANGNIAMRVAPVGGGTGGLSEVSHDGTLTGKGTSAEPLSVVPPVIPPAPVTSVNTQTGDVVLTASSVGALATVSHDGTLTGTGVAGDPLKVAQTLNSISKVGTYTGGDFVKLAQIDMTKDGMYVVNTDLNMAASTRNANHIALIIQGGAVVSAISTSNYISSSSFTDTQSTISYNITAGVLTIYLKMAGGFNITNLSAVAFATNITGITLDLVASVVSIPVPAVAITQASYNSASSLDNRYIALSPVNYTEATFQSLFSNQFQTRFGNFNQATASTWTKSPNTAETRWTIYFQGIGAAGTGASVILIGQDTKKMYFYSGTYANLTPTAWQPLSSGYLLKLAHTFGAAVPIPNNTQYVLLADATMADIVAIANKISADFVLTSGSLKLPAIAGYTGVTIEIRLIGTIGGAAGTAREVSIQLQRGDGLSVVSEKAIIKINDATLTSKAVTFDSYTIGATDPFTTLGIRPVIDNTSTQTVTLTGFELLLKAA